MGQTDYDATRPLVSVITVCFNDTPTRIRKTMANIAAQSYERIEQVVVDGGSAESTRVAIREFSNNIDHMISEPDRGIYDAMNKGVKLSSGGFLFFMNIGDRFLTEDTLSEMIRVTIARPEYGFYYGNHLNVGEDGSEAFSPMPQPTRFNLFDRTICHQTVLARREVFDRIGGFEQSYAPMGDQEWLLRALAAGIPGLHTGITVCEYELGGDWSRDMQRRRRARAQINRQHFSWWERGLFSLGWLILKSVRRLRTRNFAVPVGWQRVL